MTTNAERLANLSLTIRDSDPDLFDKAAEELTGPANAIRCRVSPILALIYFKDGSAVVYDGPLGTTSAWVCRTVKELSERILIIAMREEDPSILVSTMTAFAEAIKP